MKNYVHVKKQGFICSSEHKTSSLICHDLSVNYCTIKKKKLIINSAFNQIFIMNLEAQEQNIAEALSTKALHYAFNPFNVLFLLLNTD